MAEAEKPTGLFKRVWNVVKRPSARYSLLTLLGGGFVAGIVFWGSFNTVMEATNTMPFCTSCHEMKDNVYKEYDATIHHSNRTGVQAVCSDCHVPKEWTHKMVRKIQASNEVFHWLLGSVNTPEKFDAKRLTLAKNVWNSMKSTDSRECRNCHTLESMNPEFQKPRARQQHLAAMEVGNTCIDCHKGIAHKNVRTQLSDAEIETLEKPVKDYIKTIPASYREGLARADAREKAAEAARKAEIDAAVKSAVAAATAKAAPAAGGAAPAGGDDAGGKINWGSVEPKTLGLFFPGQASFEWVQNGRDHGGARAFTRGGDRCVTCHDKEVRDMGAKIVKGDKAEATPIPGKRPFVDVKVQTARDAENIYFRFEWQKGAHAAVPFAEGGKLDAKNEAKLTLMFAGEKVERAAQAGCWTTCHSDARNMPDAPKKEATDAFVGKDLIDLANGVTKYLAESRTAIELKESPRGGWDKLKTKDELAALAKDGSAMEFLRWRANEAPEHGLIVADRHAGGLTPIKASGALNGETYSVVIARPLKGTAPGEITFVPGKKYVFNVALHDDFASSRFHHVSLAYELTLDGEAEFVAKAQ
jgi:cytochrome c-type protein NapC